VKPKVSRAAKRVLASDSQLMVDDNNNNNTYVRPSSPAPCEQMRPHRSNNNDTPLPLQPTPQEPFPQTTPQVALPPRAIPCARTRAAQQGGAQANATAAAARATYPAPDSSNRHNKTGRLSIPFL
jgi:hypothetical protein